MGFASWQNIEINIVFIHKAIKNLNAKPSIQTERLWYGSAARKPVFEVSDKARLKPVSS